MDMVIKYIRKLQNELSNLQCLVINNTIALDSYIYKSQENIDKLIEVSDTIKEYNGDNEIRDYIDCIIFKHTLFVFIHQKSP